MSTHNIGFYEDLTKIIFQLSSNTHLIFSTIQVSITSNTVGEGSPMRLSGLSELLAVDRGRPVFIDPPTLRGSSLGVLPV